MTKPHTLAPSTGDLKKPKVPVKVPTGLAKGLAKGVVVKTPGKVSTKSSTDKPLAAIDKVDTRFLQTLMGYNARRAALSIIELFLVRLAPYGLKPVDFSVMSTIQHNPA